MKLKLLISICFILFLNTCLTAQNTVGTQFNDIASLDGYTLFSPRTTEIPRYTYLIDNCGKIVNQWESEFPLFSTDYLLEDGSLFRSVIDDQSTLDLPGNTGRIEHISWDGTPIWSATISDTDMSFHHDYVVLENGNIIMLVAFRMSAEQAIAQGRDPLTIINDELYEERVWEIVPIGTNDYSIIWEWRSWDHLIQDFDNTKENFGDVGGNPQKVDINYGVSFGEGDWWHSNSISYNPERDHITISNRNFDEFIIIDHSMTTEEAATNLGGNSGKGGDILYRYGNPESYRQGTEEDRTLNGMHDVHFIPDGSPNAGKILIFNNQPALDFSEILIIDPEFDTSAQNYVYNGGAYGPGSIDFSYTDPVNFFASFLSGSQELPNGNFLITSGPFGELFEITPSGEMVWEYFSPVGNSGILADGEDPNAFQTRVFRSLKYPANYIGFEGKDLTPGNAIELNPVDDNCQTLDVVDYNLSSSKVIIFPNPAIDKINIVTKNNIVGLNIYSLNGSLLISSQSSTVMITEIPAGLYLASIQYSDGKTQTLKFIKK